MAVALMEQRVSPQSPRIAPPQLGGMTRAPPHSIRPGRVPRAEHLLVADRFPVHRSGRGGQLTYHGPGQRVVYVMLDLKRLGGDVRQFVQTTSSGG